MTGSRTSPSPPWPGPRLPATGSSGEVVGRLRSIGPMTRSEIGSTMGLSRTTVSATVAQLMQEGWVKERPASGTVNGPGRPATVLTLTRRAGVAIGVDLGRSHARVVLADLGHEVIAEQSLVLPDNGDATAAIDAVEALITDVVAAGNTDRADIVGIGLGLPAPLDTSGHSTSITIPPDWVRQDPAQALAQRLGVPVAVENDANLGALAEARWGAGRRFDTLFYVKASTGIGAGLVFNGRLFRGTAGTAGEIGHVTVNDNGLVCRCGSRGCLEVSVGGPALVAQIGHNQSGITSLGGLITAALAGDLACSRVLADAGETLGVAIATVLNILNPDRVILGGELGGAGELVLSSLRESLGRHALASAVRSTSVVHSQLGQRAEALGAVLLVLTEAERFTPAPGRSRKRSP